MSPAAMIKTSAALYATLTGREGRGEGGGDHKKKGEGIESLAPSAAYVPD